MAINSRQKGAAGERELRDLFRECGHEARRGRQYSGSQDSPDVVHSIEWLHAECKRVEALNLYAAMEQASRDAGFDKVPVVFHRRNGRRWVAIVDAEWFLRKAGKLGEAG